MGNISEKFNSYLKMFNHNDPIYKSVFCDKNGIENATIINPKDLNIGAIASMLEYNRRLTISLRKQIFLNQAVGDILDDFCYTIFGLQRIQGETDAQFSDRVTRYILSNKVSPAAIINVLKNYSSQMPEIIEGQLDAAFADVTFATRYKSMQQCLDTNSVYYGWWIMPAIPIGTDGGEFYFTVIMYDLEPQNILTVIEIINDFKVAGVGYGIEIVYT